MNPPTNKPDPEFEAACQSQLERFFAAHYDAELHRRAMKALRLLRASDKPLPGKVEGWAAGIIYAVATYDRQACGVPGVLNSDFEAFMGVSMSMVRQRAATVREFLIL
jgi:hypothetical protein